MTWTKPEGDDSTGGTVSTNPAYPGSEIWNQPIWASVPQTTTLHKSGTEVVTGTAPGQVTAGSLFQQLGAMSASQMAAYQKKLVQAKLLSPTSLSAGGADDATMGAFAELFMIAIRVNQGKPPAQRQTWTELLDGFAQAGKAATQSEAVASAPQPTTTTSEQVYLTGKDDASAYLTQAMTELLGRAPSKKQVAQFTSRLNTREEANPSVTTTHNDGYGNTSSTTESGDVSASGAADNFVNSDKFDKERGAFSIQQYATALTDLFGGG